jgi:hypothetical protein
MTRPPRPTAITAAAVLLFAYAGIATAVAAGLTVLALVVPPGFVPFRVSETPLLISSAFLLYLAGFVVVRAVVVLRGTKDAVGEGIGLIRIGVSPAILLTILVAACLLTDQLPRPGLTFDRDTLLVAGATVVYLTSGVICIAGWLLRRHAVAYLCWAYERRRPPERQEEGT